MEAAPDKGLPAPAHPAPSGLERQALGKTPLVAIAAFVALLSPTLLNGVPFVYADSIVYASYGRTILRQLGLGAPEMVPEAAELEARANKSSAKVPPVAGPQDPDRALSEKQEKEKDTSAGEAAPKPSSPSHPGESQEEEEELGIDLSRSLYYSVLLGLPPPWTLWVAALLQCAASVALLLIAVRRSAMSTSSFKVAWGILLLSFVTPLGVFVSLAMPDVWVGLLILGSGLLFGMWERLHRIEIGLCSGVVVFGCLVHSSHTLVLFGLVSACSLAWLLRWWQGRRPSIQPTLWLVGLFVVGSLGILASNKVLESRGSTGYRRPHLTAHLIDAGPGMAFIQAHCQDRDFAVCKIQSKLPAEWRRFLFLLVGRLPPSEQKVLSDQDMAFAIATFQHDPLGVLWMAVVDPIEQLVRFRHQTAPTRGTIGESGLLPGFETETAQAVRQGRLYPVEWPYTLWNILIYVSAALSVAYLVGWAWAGRKWSSRGPSSAETAEAWRLRKDVEAVLLVAVLGVVLNAVVCGGLASPYDRFQARVVWVLPALAGLIFGSGPLRSWTGKERHDDR